MSDERTVCGETVEVGRNDEDGTLVRKEWQPRTRGGDRSSDACIERQDISGLPRRGGHLEWKRAVARS
jgi:hypothetical protein